MKERYCYWSVVDGPYARMMQTVVDSARQVGVFKDFQIWTDSPIEGATCHPAVNIDKTLYLFKLRFLRDYVSKLDYDYFVWLDADSYFVRDPGDLLRLMQGSPVHSSLESDACLPNNTREDWWGCPLKDYATLMRFMGVRSRAIYNVNAGFWIVHRDVITRFCELAFDFWDLSKRAGFEFTEEAPLAYATHMLCGNPYLHTLRATADIWASDWTGNYDGRLPDGTPWDFTDYFNFEKFKVNPAIVHAMRSKQILHDLGIRKASRLDTTASAEPSDSSARRNGITRGMKAKAGTARRTVRGRLGEATLPKAAKSKPAKAKLAARRTRNRPALNRKSKVSA